jgi:hypothetical protein
MEDVELTPPEAAGRLACLGHRVTTSARKWEREGLVRTIVLMWTSAGSGSAASRPSALHRWYYRGMAASGPAPRRSGSPRGRHGEGGAGRALLL